MKKHKKPRDEDAFFAGLFENELFTHSVDPTPLELWDFS